MNMKICVPIENYEGFQSRVCGHFGSAPLFVLVDSESREISPMDNQNRVHEHGQCSPVKALAGADPDAVVVGGIGPGALIGLRRAGIRVFQAAGATIAQVIELMNKNSLKELTDEASCGGHGNNPGCGHK